MMPIFQTIAFKYGIREGIDDGRLCPLKVHQVSVDGFDLSGLRKSGGDLRADDIASRLGPVEIGYIADVIARERGSKQGLTFMSNVSKGREMNDALCRRRVRARFICGETSADERAEVLAGFAAGEIDVLVNVALLTEGYDAPFVSFIANVRPTYSHPLYTQTIGRVLRLHPGKEFGEVWDFVGNTGRHSLVSTAGLLADGENLDAETLAILDELLAENATDKPSELIQKAKVIAEERRVVRHYQQLVAFYEKRRVDPFALVETSAQRAAAQPAEGWQLRVLKGWGVPVPKSGINRVSANRIIEGLRLRDEHGLCSYKQAAQLAQRNLGYHDVSKEDATFALAAIEATGWRWVPDEIRNDPRFAPRREVRV